jgi:hypothetical protein
MTRDRILYHIDADMLISLSILVLLKLGLA